MDFSSLDRVFVIEIVIIYHLKIIFDCIILGVHDENACYHSVAEDQPDDELTVLK